MKIQTSISGTRWNEEARKAICIIPIHQRRGSLKKKEIEQEAKNKKQRVRDGERGKGGGASASISTSMLIFTCMPPSNHPRKQQQQKKKQYLVHAQIFSPSDAREVREGELINWSQAEGDPNYARFIFTRKCGVGTERTHSGLRRLARTCSSRQVGTAVPAG